MKCNIEREDLRFIKSVLGDCLKLLNDILGSNVEDGLIDMNDQAFLDDISAAYFLTLDGLEKKD